MQKVVDLSILSDGLRLSIVSSTQKGLYFDSRVETIEEDSLFISMPYSHGLLMPLTVGSSLECMFVSRNKRYSFKSKVAFFVNERIKKVAITYPLDLLEIDLRLYFRVPVEHFVKISPFFPEQFNFRKSEPERFVYYASLIDLSGGGAKLYCKNGLSDIEFIDIDFSPLIAGLRSIRCRVTRSVEISNKNYDIGAQFIDLKDFERDQIVKYIFKKQIEIRNSVKGG